MALGFGIIAGVQAVQAGYALLGVALIAALLALAAAGGSAARVFLLCGALGCGIGALAGLRSGSPELPVLATEPSMPIAGVVIDDPEYGFSGAEARVRWQDAEGTRREAFVTLPLAVAIGRGDRVAIVGKVTDPFGTRVDALSVIVTEEAGSLEQTRWRVRETIARTTQEHVPGSAGSLALGLLIGDDSGLTEDERNDLRGAGLSHLTAVSGWNVTFVTATVGTVIVLLGFRGWRSSVVQLLALAGFVWIVGFDPPVVRAALMGVAAIVAVRLGRPAHGFTVLLLAAAMMVAISPPALTRPAFLLSLLATIGILIAARLTEGIDSRVRLVALPVISTTLAGLLTAPVIAMLFGTFTPAMIPANVLAAPLAAPATILGVLVWLTAPIPVLADVIGWIAWFACSAILTIARVCAAVPYGQFQFAPIRGREALAAYAVAGAAVLAILPEGRAAARHLFAWVVREPRPAVTAVATVVAVLSIAVLTT